MALTMQIMKMFGRSPIRPLQQHMELAHRCAAQLIPFFEAAFVKNWPDAAAQQAEISALEDKADEMKTDLMTHLPKSLFLPVPRTDILELLIAQDRIANKAKDISGIVLGREMAIPEVMVDGFRQFLLRTVDASAQAMNAINELDELLETGFRGNEVNIVHDMIHQLDAIEKDTDIMQIAQRKLLFTLEKNLPAVDAIFLYKLLDWTGDLADRAQVVGGRLNIMLAQ